MLYKSIQGLLTKILLGASLYVCAQNPEARGTLLDICQFTLKAGVHYWNIFSEHWNTGDGKKEILSSLDTNPYYLENLKTHSQELQLIREIANDIELMPKIEMNTDKLILKAPLTDEILLEVEHLDKIEEF